MCTCMHLCVCVCAYVHMCVCVCVCVCVCSLAIVITLRYMNYNVQVENLVAIELAYINTKHPDFAEAYTVHRSVSDHAAGDTHRSLSSSSLARNMVDKQAEEVKVGQLGDEKK